MITVENTDNLAGVTICGDYEDLYNLVDAFHTLTISEDDLKYSEYIYMSIRVLGLCYDIRHASQGDREVVLVDNGMTSDCMVWHEMVVPKKNVYYSCNCMYPEMIYDMMALNELVRIRIEKLSGQKNTNDGLFHKHVVWDEVIANIRFLQSQFNNCVKRTLTPAAYARWINLITSNDSDLYKMPGQYMDLLNNKYHEMDKEEREKSISVITKRISQYKTNPEYIQLSRELEDAAVKLNCPVQKIRFKGLEYPEVIKW